MINIVLTIWARAGVFENFLIKFVHWNSAGNITGGFGLKKFILSPALGYANEHWDVGIRYENFSGGNDSYGLVGLRLAYGFGL